MRRPTKNAPKATEYEVVICLDCGQPLFQEQGLAVEDWTLFCERCPQPSTTQEESQCSSP